MSEIKSNDRSIGAERSERDETQQPSNIGSYTIAIARALEASGIDSARIFQAVGIPRELAVDPMTRLPTATMTRLFRTCVDVTNNPYFGLTVAKFVQPSHMHALGYALAASSTLMDFCRRLQRYFRLLSQVASISLTEVNNQVLLRFAYLDEISEETEDAFFSFLIGIMRQLYKPGFNPLRMELHRRLPLQGAEPYEAVFRAPVTFSNKTSLLVLDKADLSQALNGSSSELAMVHDNIVISYLARLDKSDVITGVTQKIIEFLAGGECSRDQVASALCMSPTSLQLKLSQRGTNFQQLLDNTRKELACNYLRRASLPVTEITFLLGFSDTSNFTRAFKRWTGMSPTDFRLQI